MVPLSSHGVSRVPRYSGSCSAPQVFVYMTLTFSGVPSHALLLTRQIHIAVRTPKILLPLVWPLSRSLATTRKISVDFSSSPYLDVSVQAVPLIYLWIQYMMTVHNHCRIPPFGILRIDVCLRLPVAYRCLPRPSSAPNAKAFSLRSL